jgi:hypothetical protein
MSHPLKIHCASSRVTIYADRSKNTDPGFSGAIPIADHRMMTLPANVKKLVDGRSVPLRIAVVVQAPLSILWKKNT